jgi:hypothetical protein
MIRHPLLEAFGTWSTIIVLRGYIGPAVTDGLETYNGVLADAKIP